MFDQCLPYRLIQTRKNKYPQYETYIKEFIYRFYRHNQKGCIKYIVSVKTYMDDLLTLDYYPKINITPKLNSTQTMRHLRYRMLTKQNSFGVIGGTILDIMQDIEIITNCNTWGFLAANLLTENNNSDNKRYQVYQKIIRRTYYQHHQIYGSKENSVIFVIPDQRIHQVKKLVKSYEKIFSETN